MHGSDDVAAPPEIRQRLFHGRRQAPGERPLALGQAQALQLARSADKKSLVRAVAVPPRGLSQIDDVIVRSRQDIAIEFRQALGANLLAEAARGFRARFAVPASELRISDARPRMPPAF